MASGAKARIHSARLSASWPFSGRQICRRGLFAAGVAVGAVAGFAALPTSAGASRAAPELRGLATVAAAPSVPGGMHLIGTVAGSQQLSGAVALKSRDAAGLESFATDVSTPGSAVYRQFITPARFARLYGPTSSALAAVSSELRAEGLRIRSVSANGLLVNFTGSAARIRVAFHTGLGRFRLSDGSVDIATTSAVRLPASIAGDVATVVGLDDVVVPHRVGLFGRGARPGLHPAAKAPATAQISGAPNACADAEGAASSLGGLTDSQIAASYGVDGLYSAGDTGAGKTVAIFELEPYSATDVRMFDTCYFGASGAASMTSRLHTVPVDGGQQPGLGSGEAALDVEDVSAIAPGASIYVYEAPLTEYGALDEYNVIVSQDKAQEITSSWGACESSMETGAPGTQALENTIFEEAAAQGESVFGPAGDDGSDDCAGQSSSPVAPVLSVDDPGSQPFVTSVGGTTIDDATQPPVEEVWNDGSLWGAGGGGISDSWPEPTWQLRAKVPGLDNAAVVDKAEAYATSHRVGGGRFCLSDTPEGAHAAACREVPDVSAQADEFTGAITVVYDSSWTTFGGTSSATPLWAAMTAVMSDSASCGPAGTGFIDPALYAIASNPSEYAASFTDVTNGNNDPFGAADLYPATTGYDMASGLGTPRVTGPGGTAGLAYYLCAQAKTAAAPTITSVSPRAIFSGGGIVTVTGAGFESGATSRIAGVQLGGVALGAASIVPGSLKPTSFRLAVPAASVFVPPGTGNDGAGRYYLSVTSTDGSTSRVGPANALEVVGRASSTAPVVTGVGPSGGNMSGENGKTPITTTVYGSGFTGAKSVRFGGVASASFIVNASGNEITATVPPFKAGKTVCLKGDVGVCQVQVVVTTVSASSITTDSTILPPYQGAYSLDNSGDFDVPHGCRCEGEPQSTEFDYLPTPHITRLTADVAADGRSYVSEDGGTVVTLTGVGFGVLGFEWLDSGHAPNKYSSYFSTGISYVSATELQFLMPGPAAVPKKRVAFAQPFYVQTLASPNSGDISAAKPAPSNEAQVVFAPTPIVTSVATTSSPAAGPSIGGTKLVIKGSGFTAAAYVGFTDEFVPSGVPSSEATSYDLTIVSNSEITLRTPDSNPGIDEVQVCTTSGCSVGRPTGDIFIYYPLGYPSVSSAAPKSGPAKGGTKVFISGTNLGFVIGVRFAKAKAAHFGNVASLLDSGNTHLVYVIAPPGKVGTSVLISVETLESLKAGRGYTRGVRTATFTYVK